MTTEGRLRTLETNASELIDLAPLGVRLVRSRILCEQPLTGVGRFPIWPAAQQSLPRARPITVADVHNHA